MFESSLAEILFWGMMGFSLIVILAVVGISFIADNNPDARLAGHNREYHSQAAVNTIWGRIKRFFKEWFTA